MKSKLVIAHSSNFHAPPENTEEGILSHNLLQMRSSMMRLLLEESVGGNAGTIQMRGKPISCAAARGFADAHSGKIMAFGNYQDVPENIRSAYPEFVFRIAVGFGLGPFSNRCREGRFGAEAYLLEPTTGKHPIPLYSNRRTGLGSPWPRIMECYSDGSFSSQAKAMLKKTMERWNSTSAAGRRAA